MKKCCRRMICAIITGIFLLNLGSLVKADQGFTTTAKEMTEPWIEPNLFIKKPLTYGAGFAEAYSKGFVRGYEVGYQQEENSTLAHSLTSGVAFPTEYLQGTQAGFQKGYRDGLEKGLEDYHRAEKKWQLQQQASLKDGNHVDGT